MAPSTSFNSFISSRYQSWYAMLEPPSVFNYSFKYSNLFSSQISEKVSKGGKKIKSENRK
jgi:hypothetical protein